MANASDRFASFFLRQTKVSAASSCTADKDTMYCMQDSIIVGIVGYELGLHLEYTIHSNSLLYLYT